MIRPQWLPPEYIDLVFCLYRNSFNIFLLIFSVWADVMLHLQILQEEKYLLEEFGQEYIDYKNKVMRYIGRK